MTTPRAVALILIVACAIGAPAWFASRDFTVSDETRYAEVLRSMRDEGRWIVPYLNGRCYPDKRTCRWSLHIANGHL